MPSLTGAGLDVRTAGRQADPAPRRVTFDLIGLPPTPEEIDAFLKDDVARRLREGRRSAARRRRTTASAGAGTGSTWSATPRRTGTSSTSTSPTPGATATTSIRAFNADLPYDQFVVEHVAGDLLPKPRRNPKDGSNESILGTGFWLLGEAKHSPVDSRAEYADRIDNQIDVFGKTFLGLTVACARCHDHKFDPIATKDYYSLFSVLASSRYNRADHRRPGAHGEAARRVEAGAAKNLTSLAWERATSKRARCAVERLARQSRVPFELFGAGWRSRWDASGLAFRAEGGDGFPHSGREVRELAGALRSPTFTIDKPYLAIRVAGRDAKARLILNGLQLIQDADLWRPGAIRQSWR